MADNRTIKRYYLDRLAEYRKAGYDDYKAADLAEKDTKKKFGRLPG
jgi:hypothetical protein